MRRMQMVLFPWRTGSRKSVPNPALALSFAAALILAGCANPEWDLRTNASSTAGAAAAAARPTPDANGVISYSGYQVVVARAGDTVATVAQRLGVDATNLASYNALQPNDPLRDGEVLALPTRVASTSPAQGGIIGQTSPGDGVDVASIASSAINSATANGTTAGSAAAPIPFQPAQPGPEPLRHQVKRGETAFSIANEYNVTVKDLADWNGLGPDFAVREGQYLLIPTTASATTPPGKGSPTPMPPSASQPLPTQNTQTAAQVAKTVPPSPDLGSQRTAASASKFVMPVTGPIIRPYQKGKNEGVDISAAAGSPVKAADDGTVAAITSDTQGTPIVVIRHANNILTVYAGIDSLSVAKGDTVKRGQVIGQVKAGNPAFLHFEVRQGIDAVDPMPYLQ